MGKKYEVVVSGMAGMFPESEGVPDLKQFLYDKVNLVTTCEAKWNPGELGVPTGVGKLTETNKFDLGFFGIHRMLGECLDPLTSICLKCSFEAVCDAGVHPSELAETRTAVLFGSVVSESELHSTMHSTTGYGMLGRARTMNANRVSYYFNVKGPSVVIGCSWAEGVQILDIATRLISGGHAVAAIVGVANLITSPEMSYTIDRMGRLTKSNETKSFCDTADGCNRSESCVVFFLQRADHALRSYGSIMRVLTVNCGSREKTFIGNCPQKHKKLLEEIYRGVDRSKIAFVELEGAAIKNVDAMEMNAVDEVINVGRQKPLLIGSVKSNLGHTETAAAFVAMVKALIALDTGIIPPNLHYSTPNSESPALVNGKLQVVTTATPLEGNLVGINTMGLMGTYGHIILKQHPKQKSGVRTDDLPRLVVLSGREEEALELAFKKVEAMPVDEEFVGLLHHLFKKKIPNHFFRGYSILGGVTDAKRNIQHWPESSKRPIWFVFSGMGSQWPGMGTSLMKLPVFEAAIKKCHEVLLPKGVDVINILTNPDPSIFDSILCSFVGIAAVQIGLVDVLKALGIKPDGIVGHSVGELGCAYADGCFTAEQMILSAYARGRASVETKLEKGKMAAVGMGYNEIKGMIPSTIEVACHNAGDSCTLSGPDKDMEDFICQIKDKGVFAKLVNVGNIAYHSKYIRPAAPALLKYLKEVIPTPNTRSASWISSSIPKSKWDTDLAKYSSAEYHTNNLLSPVFFHEAAKEIPENALVLEIAPHGLLQAILKRSHSSCVNISLTNRSSKDGIEYLLESIGKLYLEGVDVDIGNIYPEIEFPVSRNTPAIHNLITWSEQQKIESLYVREKDSTSTVTDDITQLAHLKELELLCSQNKINGLEIVPPSLRLNTLIEQTKSKQNETSNKIIIFKNLVFNEAAEIRPKCENETETRILSGTGGFQIFRKSPIMKGYMESVDTANFYDMEECKVGNNVKQVSQQDFYEYFESVGVKKGELLRNVMEIIIGDNGISGKVVWNGSWTFFLDSLFQIISFYSTIKQTKLRVTSHIRNVIIELASFPTDNAEIDVLYDYNLQILRCKGLQFDGISTIECCIFKDNELKFDEPVFVPYHRPQVVDLKNGINVCVQLLIENIDHSKVRIFNIKGNNNVMEIIYDCFLQLESIQLMITEISDINMIQNLDLNELREETCLIISDSCSNDIAMNLLQNVKEGFFLSSGDEQCKLPKELPSTILFEHHSINYNLTFLKKAPSSEFGRSEIITFSNDQLENTLISLKNYPVAGKDNIGRTYVVGTCSSELLIYQSILKYQEVVNYRNLRFFLLDSSCPNFSLSSHFYEAQIKKNFKVNVYRNGEWGSIRLIQFFPNILRKSLMKLPEKKQFHGFNFECFGLNLKNDFKTLPASSMKLGTLEYSGVDKKGKQLFGCCSLTDYEFIKRDTILCWEKPNNWTYEDAATVPLAYATAYHIFNHHDREWRSSNRMLINDGLAPISVAIISVAVSLGYEIFTTYRNEEEKLKLKELFPQLSEENMFSHQNVQYGYRVLEMSKFKGIGLSINTTDDVQHLKASVICVGYRGQCFQVNSRLLNDNSSFGMDWFLKERRLSGLNPDCLINLPDKEKIMIHETMKQGIESGVVKPLPLKTTTSNEKMAVLINSNRRCKVVLKTNEANEVERKTSDEYYVCGSGNGYLIVGSNQGFWVDIILWLVQRGALVFTVVFEEKHSSISNELRLNSILQLHPNVKIHFLQSEKFISKFEAKSTLYGWSKFYPLASVFVLEMMEKNTLSNLEAALRELAPKCRFICFGAGELLCHDRFNQGFPALFIKLGRSISTPSYVLQSLDYLMCNMGKIKPVVYVSEKKRINSTEIGTKIPLQKYSFMPSNITELDQFSLLLGERAYFEEVTTMCPRYSVAREFQPFFIVPGLKANEMELLTSRLMCPAFQVKLPEHLGSLQSVADNLVEELLKFGQHQYTIIASDWGNALALKITELLEIKGKSALLILLGSEPSSIKMCARTMLANNCNKLIHKYFKQSSQLNPDWHPSKDWEVNLDLLFNDIHTSNMKNRTRLRKGLNALKIRLEEILSFSLHQKLSSRVIYIKPKGCIEDSVTRLQQHLKQPLKFSVTNEVDFEEMARNPELSKAINCYVLFEHQDRARVDNYEFCIPDYPVSKGNFYSSLYAFELNHKNFDDMNFSLFSNMKSSVAKIQL